jgi:hypothetical protein
MAKDGHLLNDALTRGCNGDINQIVRRNLLGRQGNGSVQKYSASSASFAEILCTSQIIQNVIVKICLRRYRN